MYVYTIEASEIQNPVNHGIPQARKEKITQNRVFLIKLHLLYTVETAINHTTKVAIRKITKQLHRMHTYQHLVWFNNVFMSMDRIFSLFSTRIVFFFLLEFPPLLLRL